MAKHETVDAKPAQAQPEARMHEQPDADFWAVFACAPDAYLLRATDAPRFTMLAANDARLHATMSRPEDVIGRPLFDVFPDNPTDPGATGVRNLRASLYEVLRTRKPHRMALQKYDIRTPDGQFEERYWDPLNSPVLDDDGNVIYIIHRVEDVTDEVRTARRLQQETAALAEERRARQRIETVLEKLRESEERYRLLVDMIPQNVWTTDPEGHHTYFSRRWYDFTGATEDASHGEGWMAWIHPDDRERMLARWQHSLDTGDPYEIEYRFRGADGEYHWFLGKAMPLRDAAGEIVEWFGTATDISERKRLDAEREQLLERERASRQRVTTILESITDAFFAVDREWRLTYVNGEAERLLRRRRDEVLGRILWEEFSRALGSTFEHEYRRAMAEQTTVHFEAFSPAAGIWVDVRAYPSRDGLSVFFRDVTPRKEAEEQLRESEARFRALGNSIPQLAWMADATGWIFWYNDRWHEYTGTTLEEMEGWGWQKVHHPDHVARVVERIRHSFETGEPWEDTFPLRSRTGEYRWFLSRALPIRDAHGAIVRWFGTNTDITDQLEAAAERERLLERERAAREEAEQRRTELERVTESRAGLIRGFSHDVKNPLTVADMTAQLLEVADIPDEERENVRSIRRSIRTSLRLIEDLLDIARAEAGQLEIECMTTDVSVIAREVVDDSRAPATAAGLTLEVRVPDALSADTDPTRLRQILGNLISNAVKYAPNSHVTVDAEPRHTGGPRPGDWIAVSVRDTGPGIPDDKKEAVFQEYTRLDPTAQPGAGIGLAISRRIARLLGGDLTLESEAGQGATFTLWLPPARPS
jgi:PAS domain S-box-containing protein